MLSSSLLKIYGSNCPKHILYGSNSHGTYTILLANVQKLLEESILPGSWVYLRRQNHLSKEGCLQTMVKEVRWSLDGKKKKVWPVFFLHQAPVQSPSLWFVFFYYSLQTPCFEMKHKSYESRNWSLHNVYLLSYLHLVWFKVFLKSDRYFFL